MGDNDNSAFMLTLRILCQCASTLMILSPTPTVYRIYKTKDIGVASVVPLVAVLGNSYSWMLYGYMGGNIFPIFTNFLTGVVAATIFIAVYYRFTPDRPRVHRVVGFEIAALSIVTLYFALALAGVTHQSRASATLVVGAMGVFFSMKLYGAGLERIRLVLQHRTAVYIPLHMVCMGTINNALWVVYTSLDDNWLMFGCCLTSCVLSVAQVLLYVVFHPDGRRAAAAKAKAIAEAHDKEHVVIRSSGHHEHIVGVVTVDARPSFDVEAASAKASGATAASPVFVAMRSPVLSPLQHPYCERV